MIACGLDFGTSNSAIGVMRDGVAELAPIEAGDTLMPSAVFFDYETRGRVLLGNAAIAAYVEQTEGRLMRALKSILGSPLIDEETSLGGRKVPLTHVVEIFVRNLKEKAEQFAGREIASVVMGRPVRFVDDDDQADARAQSVLERVARQAGTSDFSIVRVGPERRARADRSGDVLASTGVRVGGTDLDTALSLASVMPLLGLGTQLVKKGLPMPNALYHQLATWATINFAYTYRNEREVTELVSLAREPEKVSRLLRLLQAGLGHRLAFTVEDAKIALSAEQRVAIPLTFLESGLSALATRALFDRAIGAATSRLQEAAGACISAAGLKPAAIETIFLTGGSSRVPAVRQAVARTAPDARIAGGSDLLSVALGLAQMSGRVV